MFILRYIITLSFCVRVVAESTVEEMRRLQAHWMDLRQYIRMVYRMAMEVKSPTDGYQDFIKEHVQKCVIAKQ